MTEVLKNIIHLLVSLLGIERSLGCIPLSYVTPQIFSPYQLYSHAPQVFARLPLSFKKVVMYCLPLMHASQINEDFVLRNLPRLMSLTMF